MQPAKQAAAGVVRALIVCLLLSSATDTGAEAQAIRGRLIDAATGLPIHAGQVSGSDSDGRLVATAITDSVGMFTLRLNRAGTYMLAAKRIGYETLTSAGVEVAARQLVELTLRMSSATIPLDAITVEARRIDPRHLATFEGFLARRELLPRIGSRRAVLRDDPEMFAALRIQDVLNWFPRARCVDFLVNGYPPMRGEVELVLSLSMDHFEGVEFYRNPVEAPLEMRRSGSCAVVVLWTWRGSQSVQGRPPGS